MDLKEIFKNSFFTEIAAFLWKRKAYWLVPVIVFLILFIVLIMIGTSPASVFIYPLI